jgi:sugar phosphate isomerase/epimerase
MTTRRNFLGLSAAALAMPSAVFAKNSVPLGLQLYTVRADLAKDFEGTIKTLRGYGIRHVQANLTQSGKSSRDQKKLYDREGISWKSIHAGGDALKGGLDATIAEAKSVGITNITCSFPLFPADRATIMAGPSVADWQANVDAFNKIGETCRRAGLTFAYHNHNLEFRKIGDMVPYDMLLQQTDPEVVQFEMDIGWVVAGGADPVAYLKKYPNRYHSLHIKDLKDQGIPNTSMKMISAIIGKGIVKWDQVLAAAKDTRVERAFLEIEEPYDPSPLEMVRQSYDYLHGVI